MPGFRALNDDEERTLTESIKRFGVLVPVVVDHEGNIVDGHNRQRIAASLGVPYPITALPDGASADDVAQALNLARRHLAPEERAVFLVQLAELSNRAAAAVMGVGETTVRRDRADTAPDGAMPSPVVRTARDGSKRRAKQLTPEQRAARNAEARRMRDEDGATNVEIAQAFGTTDTRTVRRWLQAADGVTPKQRAPKADADQRLELLQAFQDTCNRLCAIAHDAELLARRLSLRDRTSLFVQHGRQAANEAVAHITNLELVFTPVADDPSSITDSEGSE